MKSARSIECAPKPFCSFDCKLLSPRALTVVATKRLTISIVALIRTIDVVRLIFKMNATMLTQRRSV